METPELIERTYQLNSMATSRLVEMHRDISIVELAELLDPAASDPAWTGDEFVAPDHKVWQPLWALVCEKLATLFPSSFRQIFPRVKSIVVEGPGRVPREFSVYEHRSTVVGALQRGADACRLIASMASRSAPDDSDVYLPAGAYPKGLGDRLRKATSPDRKTKRVASRVADGVTLYRDSDVMRYWGHEIREARKGSGKA